MPDVTTEQPPKPDTKDAETVNDGRREAMRKMAKYAAYAAPALVALLTADKAMATIGSPIPL